MSVGNVAYKFFQIAKLIQDKEKYFHIHIPNALANFLSLTTEDQVKIFVNADQREVLLKIESPLMKVDAPKKRKRS